MKFPVNFQFARRRPPGPGKNRFLQIIGVLLLAVTLQACSLIKIAYNQAAELAYWQLHAYFDFNDIQTPKVREELAKVHQWHRQTQLPAYIETLEKWQGWLPGELDEAKACGIFDEVRGKLQTVTDRALPSAGAVVGSLGQEQLEAMKRKFAKLNASYRSDFLDGKPADLLEKRFEKAVDRAERLYGTLEEKQLAVLRHRIIHSAFDARMSLAEHQRRQRDAVQTLSLLIAGQSTPEQAKLIMQAYFERVVHSPDAAFRSYQDRLARDNCKTFAALHNSTTTAQRAKAVQTLQSYAKDFSILVAQR